MTLLLALWRLITGNPIARAIGGAVAALAALWAYGMAKKREGASTARADAAAKAAKADQQAHERMNDADLGIGATDGERIERLRDFAAKHRTGQAKGKGG